MFKSCVKAADYLLISGELTSTHLAYKNYSQYRAMDKSQVISILSKIISQTYTHSKSAISPLFEQLLYPVSKAPITMKKRLRKVYNK